MTENLDLEELREIVTRWSPLDETTTLALINRVQAAEESHRLANVMLRTVLEEMGSGPETDPIIKVRQLVARAEAAEAAVQRVREMHKPTPARYYGTDLNPQRRNDCAACGEGTAWPCATIRTLDGGEQA